MLLLSQRNDEVIIGAIGFENLYVHTRGKKAQSEFTRRFFGNWLDNSRLRVYHSDFRFKFICNIANAKVRICVDSKYAHVIGIYVSV